MASVRSAYLLGVPFSPLYSLLMRLRSMMYRHGLLASERLPVPVISVGNLTMGGTGKTPVVAALTRFLLDSGRKPAIISRGYKGKAKGRVNLVSDGSNVTMTARECGDEPYLLARELSGALVLTGSNRVPACTEAIAVHGADCIVLDDGFQHLRVQRDLDIVLFNATTLAGVARVFPGGELREPFGSLGRADVIMLTGTRAEESCHRQEQFFAEIRRYAGQVPLLEAHYHAPQLTGPDGSPTEPAEIADAAFAFSGIAHPERFLNSLKAVGIDPLGAKLLPDHHHYPPSSLAAICSLARSAGARALVTTSKDLVKIQPEMMPLPVYCLRYDIILPQLLLDMVRALL